MSAERRSEGNRRRCGHCDGLYRGALVDPILGALCPVCMLPITPEDYAAFLQTFDRPRVRKLLAARDGWICHLCGKTIDPNARRLRRPTVDHSTPISLGGDNALENLKLAHAHCNSARGNAPLTAP